MKTPLRLSILVVLIAICSTLSAQKAREIGIRLTNFDSFGAIYKVEKKENKFLRMRLITANISHIDLDGSDFTALSLGGAIGLEKRKAFSDRITFIHGPEVKFSAAFASRDGGDFYSLSPGLGYVLGLQFDLNEHIYVGLEVLPRISYNITENSGRNSQQISAGLNSNLVALTVAHRFVK